MKCGLSPIHSLVHVVELPSGVSPAGGEDDVAVRGHGSQRHRLARRDRDARRIEARIPARSLACSRPRFRVKLPTGVRAMSETAIQVVVSVSVFVLGMTLLATMALKFIARRLSFSQCFIIALVASAVMTTVYIAFVMVELLLGLTKEYSAVGAICGMVAAGHVMTRLARKYGIERTGLGVGAKSMLVVVALSCVPIIVFYVVPLLSGLAVLIPR